MPSLFPIELNCPGVRTPRNIACYTTLVKLLRVKSVSVDEEKEEEEEDINRIIELASYSSILRVIGSIETPLLTAIYLAVYICYRTD